MDEPKFSKVMFSMGHGPSAKVTVDDLQENTLIFWKLRCVNSRTRTFFNRDLALEVLTLPLQERAAVLFCLSSSPNHSNILQYRSRFRQVEEQELQQLFAKTTNFKTVSLDDYFEDENSNALNLIGVMQLLSGQADPIILGNSQSVLRLGPAGVRQAEKWTVNKANNISHFLRLMERIAVSDWWRSPIAMEYQIEAKADTTKFPSTTNLLDAKTPTSDATRQVLLPLRQLCSNDDSFNFAVNHYMQHVDHEGKRLWVKNEKSGFNNLRSTEADFFKIESYSGQEILDLFMYGCGEVHRKSDGDAERRLNDAVSKYGPKYILASFNFAMRPLVGHALQCYPVMKQDFDHWISSLGAVGPDRLDMDDLHR